MTERGRLRMTIRAQQAQVLEEMIRWLTITVIELKRDRQTVPVNNPTPFALVLLQPFLDESFRKFMCRVARVFSSENFLKRNFESETTVRSLINAEVSSSTFENSLTDTTTHRCFANVVAGIEQMFNLFFRKTVINHGRKRRDSNPREPFRAPLG